MIGKCTLVLVVSLAAITPGAPVGRAGHAPATAPYQSADVNLPAVKRDTLLNGLKLIVIPQEGTGKVKIHLRLNAGSLFDLAGKGGLADITARALLRGAAGYSSKDISNVIEQLGLTVTSRASWDSTDLTISGPTGSFETVVDLLGRVIVNPTFVLSEVDLVKSQRLNEMISDPRNNQDPSSQKALQTLFGSFPYGRPDDGTAYTISRITRDDVVYYHDRFYLANNAELAIQGDVNMADVTRITRAKLGFWKKGEIVPATFRPPTPPDSRQIFVLDSNDSGSASAAVAEIGISRTANDYFPMLIATELLPDLVQKNSDTSLEAQLGARALAGPLLVKIKTPTDKAAAVIGQIIDAMNRIQQAQVSSDQLQHAKEQLISSYSQKAASEDGLIECLLDIETYGLGRDYLMNYGDRIRAVDSSQVAQAAQSHMNLQTLVIVVSGPASKIEPEMRKLGNVSVVKDHQATQ
ncbi:MAG TPA: pitrilysin family protein [Blastocatellia bacterium]